MSNKKVRLTEADLNRIVKKVINEQGISGAVRNAVNSLNGGSSQIKPQTTAPTNPKVKALATYLKQNNIKPADINAAFQMNRGGVAKAAQPKPQQQGGFISNAIDTAKQGIQKGVSTVQGLEQQGLNKLSQGLNSVANAVKPKQQGGVAKAAQPKPQGGVAKAAQPQSQMTPEQLKAIQGQASRVPQGR